MAVRLSGLVSNMDTDSIVKEMMAAQSLKKQAIVNKQTKLTWTQEKWKELNTKIYKLYTGDISKMRLKASYKTKAVTSTDESKVTATAGTSVALGSHKVEVSQLASSQYLTGGQLSSDTTTSTKLTKLGFKEDTIITINAADKEGNKAETQFIVSKDTTINDFVTACKGAGLNANFDDKQKRLFLSSTASGADQQFTITTSGVSQAFSTQLSKVKESINYEGLSASNQTKFDNAIMTLQSAYNEGGESIDEVLKAINGTSTDKELSAAVNTLQTFGESSALEKLKATALENVTKVFRDAYFSTDDDIKKELYNTLKEQALEEDSNLDGQELDDKIQELFANLDQVEKEKMIDASIKVKFTEDTDLYEENYTKYIEINKEQCFEDAKKALTDGLTELMNQSVFVDADGVANSDGTIVSQLTLLGLDEVTQADIDNSVAAGTDIKKGNMTVVAAKDAQFVLDGAVLTSGSNTVSVNGLSLELKGITTEAISINVTNNTQETYDMIKGFIKNYNELLSEMNEIYYADSARGYDPLTDDEKSEMTDEQIEKWEDKIKSSLLRRDNVLGSVTSAMKNALQKTVTVDGKSYSLASYGITTSSDYTEKGLLHIYGDKEDSTYADQEDKLLKALEEDPELVANVFSSVAQNLYDTLTEKMKSTSLSSALTVYNDKQMTKTQTQYTKEISDWETRLEELENRYYKQFTAMETALSNLNSQQSALSGLLS